MSQSCFSLRFFFQNSLWKLSTIHGYKGYTYWCVFGIRNVSFSQIECSGDLASRLDWVASSSRELIAWLAWEFCPVLQQLAWLFSSSACFTHMPAFGDLRAVSHSWDPIASSCKIHTSELFFTLSHTLRLHDSHLNTGFLNAELQANWHGIKPTERLIKFNLKIAPFGYSVTKH